MTAPLTPAWASLPPLSERELADGARLLRLMLETAARRSRAHDAEPNGDWGERFLRADMEADKRRKDWLWWVGNAGLPDFRGRLTERLLAEVLRLRAMVGEHAP